MNRNGKIRVEVIACIVWGLVVIVLGITALTIFLTSNKQTEEKQEEVVQTTQTPAPSTHDMYIVNVQDNATLYASPETSSGSVALIPLGSIVSVHDNSDQNGFKKVDYNGSTGFVEARYVSNDYSLVQKQQELNASAVAQEQERQRQASLPPGSNATDVKYAMWVCNVENAIYLRTHPSEEAGIITTIPVGTEVYYIDSCGPDWCKISYNGQMGYSKSKYLTASQPYVSSYSSYMTVTGVNVSAYLRRRPDSDTSSSNIICEVPLGAKVYYVDTVGEYRKVRYNGSTGYILSKYLR